MQGRENRHGKDSPRDICRERHDRSTTHCSGGRWWSRGEILPDLNDENSLTRLCSLESPLVTWYSSSKPVRTTRSSVQAMTSSQMSQSRYQKLYWASLGYWLDTWMAVACKSPLRLAKSSNLTTPLWYGVKECRSTSDQTKKAIFTLSLPLRCLIRNGWRLLTKRLDHTRYLMYIVLR